MFEIGAKLDQDPLDKQGKNQEKKKPKKVISKKEHQLVFTFEKRSGKPTTNVGRFYLSDEDKKQLLKLLKKKLSCGGKIDGEWIMLQGDCKEDIKKILSNEGWKFR